MAVAMAVGVGLLLRRCLGENSPFLLFLAAVIASAAVAGLGPGLLATALGAAAAKFFLTLPILRVSVGHSEVLGLILFGFEGSFISLLSEWLRNAVARASASEMDARQLERQILDIADRERARIGHDLHDGLGQQLLGVALLARSAHQRLADNQCDQAGAVRLIDKTVTEALGWMRDMARRLSSVAIAEEGLMPALQDLGTTTERLFGVRCSADAGQGLISPERPVVEHLYRIAQEAISNAIRHGGATDISIRWNDALGAQEVRIDDNGSGFRTMPSGGGGGIGLRIMRYRAELIGGSLELISSPRGGVGVRCIFPTSAVPAGTEVNAR